MNEFAKKLLRKNSLRKECAELDGEMISKVIEDLNEILLDKMEAEEAAQAEVKEKESAIESIKAQMAELGLSLDDVAGMVEPAKKAAVKAKYRLTDEAGKVHEWSGRGRTPLVFQQKIDAGASKDDFLIKD